MARKPSEPKSPQQSRSSPGFAILRDAPRVGLAALAAGSQRDRLWVLAPRPAQRDRTRPPRPAGFKTGSASREIGEAGLGSSENREQVTNAATYLSVGDARHHLRSPATSRICPWSGRTVYWYLGVGPTARACVGWRFGQHQ